jgi:hypothetical protein
MSSPAILEQEAKSETQTPTLNFCAWVEATTIPVVAAVMEEDTGVSTPVMVNRNKSETQTLPLNNDVNATYFTSSHLYQRQTISWLIYPTTATSKLVKVWRGELKHHRNYNNISWVTKNVMVNKKLVILTQPLSKPNLSVQTDSTAHAQNRYTSENLKNNNTLKTSERGEKIH